MVTPPSNIPFEVLKVRLASQEASILCKIDINVHGPIPLGAPSLTVTAAPVTTHPTRFGPSWIRFGNRPVFKANSVTFARSSFFAREKVAGTNQLAFSELGKVYSETYYQHK